MADAPIKQIIGAALWVTLAFSAGWFLGSGVIFNAHAKAQDPYRSLHLLAQIIRTIEGNYIEEVDTEQLIDGAIKGLVATLDPHSRYIDPETYEVLQNTANGWSIGVGLTLNDDKRITSIVDSSPASAAGLQIGDIIISIDGQIIKEMSVESVKQLLKGEVGSTLTLGIDRESKQILVKLQREQMTEILASCKGLDAEIIHLKIFEFGKGTTDQAVSCLSELSNKQVIKGIILDLRDNPGGLVEEGIALADLFINEGVITTFYERGSDTVEQHESSSNGPFGNTPLVTLINGNTASAAELTAGALQKNDRTVLMGEESYGKGSMQKIYAFDGKSALKLTISQYQLPDGSILTRQAPLVPDKHILAQSLDPKRDLKLAIENLPIENRIKKLLLNRLDLLETSTDNPDTNPEIIATDNQLKSAWNHITTQY